MDISETGKEIAEKLMFLLDENQKKEFIQYLLEDMQVQIQQSITGSRIALSQKYGKAIYTSAWNTGL